ncbi:MAG: hypothetical protein Q7S12_01765 [bacterium]|nr:hypothetical protein [bacterium]
MYTKEDLDRLLEKWRNSRGETIRNFFGNTDIQRITLYGIFPGSNVTLTSPFEDHKAWPNMVVQGWEFHLDLLYPHLEKLIRHEQAEGAVGWNGIIRSGYDRIDMTYAIDRNDPVCLIELMEYRFKCDAMIRAQLKLSEVSILEVVREDKILCREPIGLPEGIKNGDIELPLVILN